MGCWWVLRRALPSWAGCCGSTQLPAQGAAWLQLARRVTCGAAQRVFDTHAMCNLCTGHSAGLVSACLSAVSSAALDRGSCRMHCSMGMCERTKHPGWRKCAVHLVRGRGYTSCVPLLPLLRARTPLRAPHSWSKLQLLVKNQSKPRLVKAGQKPVKPRLVKAGQTSAFACLAAGWCCRGSSPRRHVGPRRGCRPV